MKFGILQFFSWPERRVSLPTVYERALERIQIMDSTGYDAVWLAEHHFSGYSVCPSVHIMGTHVAATTKNIRIGTAVSLAAFYHPLRLAEEVALMDMLSGGRVNWGAGRGFDKKELECFDILPEESYEVFHEHIDIVMAAWRDEKLNFKGKRYEFKDVEVLPKPLQENLPVWIASSSNEAITWAAEKGHAILMDPHATHVTIASKYQDYRTQLAANGHTLKQDIPMARLMAIAPTEKEALEIAKSGAGWIYDAYANPNVAATGKNVGSHQKELQKLDDPVARYMDGVVVYGTPEQVVDKLKKLEETLPLEYLLAAPLSHETFLLLTEEVMPHFL
ncbi:MAG: LLM class flavin-dependent oxidoreductase [Pseudomonadales bacterium]|nr:LLM class flavin-dependent oxidoreductase [Pseudomonadales bacterium]